MIVGVLSAALLTVATATAQTPQVTPIDAAAQLRAAAEKAPGNAAAWYALGQAYNTIKENALASFSGPADAPWRALISADGLLESGQYTDAFGLYRAALDALPSIVTIHESIARIYERTGHTQWAAIERAKVRLEEDACTARRAMCEFRAARYRSSLEAAMTGVEGESRYWTARAANELALGAFRHLDTIADSPERRSVRAATAQARERYVDAVSELKAAVRLAPQQPEFQFELASAYYLARDYEATLVALTPLLARYPDDGRLLTLEAQALVQLQRAGEAVPILKHLVERRPNDAVLKLTLGRAYVQSGDYAAAIPLLEPRLDSDTDGSLHMQLARAYAATGQRDKAAPLLTRAEELRKEDQERRSVAALRTITAPK
jgi:tetratricopeptide (TPR) repeat protein